jgi:hypothetical protein
MLIDVLGVDISLRNLGLVQAVVDTTAVKIVRIKDLKLVRTDDESGKTVRKNSDDLRRALQLRKGLHKAASECAIGIVEMPVGSQSARSMASYGVSVGVMASCPIPLIQVKPADVKEAATGDKTASKEEMIAWATALFPDAPWLRHGGKLTAANEHLADGLAAIVAGLDDEQFHQAVALAESMAV